MDPSRSFTYDELDERFFRLFQLDLNGEDEPLSGKLLTARFPGTLADQYKVFLKVNLLTDGGGIMEALSGSRSYLTLSYSWDNDSERYPLWLVTVGTDLDIDGKPVIESDPGRSGNLWITRNLRDFLLEMRRQKFKRFIWIDAICINQQSDADKDAQISRMRDFYESAESVYVWLGAASVAESESVKKLTAVGKMLNVSRDNAGQSQTLTVRYLDLPNLPLRSDPFWAATMRLLSQPWWRRLWTLQEIVIADDVKSVGGAKAGSSKMPRVTVLFGSAHLEWEQIEHFTMAVEGTSAAKHPEVLNALHGISEIRLCRESLSTNGWAVSLGPLLLATRRRQATFPGDMVIGMLAMLDRKAIRKLALSSSMPVVQIFVRFAQYYVRNEPRECLLNHTASRNRLPGLPSWCPDFSAPEETTSVGSRSLGRNMEEAEEQLLQMPHAGFEWEGKWTIPKRRLEFARLVVNVFTAKAAEHGLYDKPNRRSLQPIEGTESIRASGMSVDVVNTVTDCNRGAESEYFFALANIRQTLAWDDRCLQLARQTLPDGMAGFEVYARTITANRVTVGTKPDMTQFFDHKDEIDFSQRYLRFRKYMQTFVLSGGTSPQELDADAVQFARCVHHMSRRRRFFSTKGGRIGLGSSDVQAGDMLCVLFFCPTPYLLRSADQRTTLVGEAHVSGLMYGEALKMLERGELKETHWIIS